MIRLIIWPKGRRYCLVWRRIFNRQESANSLSKRYGLGEDIIVVSGLPRSGTSLMMQMLHAGGMPLLVDEHRPADASNERGYFEHAHACTRVRTRTRKYAHFHIFSAKKNENVRLFSPFCALFLCEKSLQFKGLFLVPEFSADSEGVKASTMGE